MKVLAVKLLAVRIYQSNPLYLLLILSGLGCQSRLDPDNVSFGSDDTTTSEQEASDSPENLPTSKQAAKFVVVSRSPVVTDPGSEVTFTGTGFSEQMVVRDSKGRSLELKQLSETQLNVELPDTLEPGITDLHLIQNDTSAVVSLVINSSELEHPLYSGESATICTATKYYNLNGQLSSGTKNCDGTTAPQIDPCTVDGQTGCVTNADFPAMKLAGIAASNIELGKQVGGLAGTLSPAPAACSTDGQIGCVTGGTFKAAATTNLEDKLLSGTAAAGVSGNVTVAPASKVLQGTQYGVGGNGSVGALTLPSANTVLVGGAPYGATDAPITGTYSPDFPEASNVRASDTVNSLPGTLADCSTEGQNDCFVGSSSAFKTAATAKLTSANIRRGIDLGGVTGNFPSAVSPLPRYSDNGSTSNTTGSDIADLTNFQTQLTSAGDFEFWDASGVRRTGSGDVDITAANVITGADFENLSVVGSAPNSAECVADGEVGCLTTSRFKAMDTDSAAISAWDIRRGKTVGGISGEIFYPRNVVRSDLFFNRTSGSGAEAGADAYDTLNGAIYGSGSIDPFGYYKLDGSNWIRHADSDNGSGGGTSGDGLCNGSEACIYTERMTGGHWARSPNSNYTWEQAITYCHNLNAANFGGFNTGWRLPTKKELTHAYVNGMGTMYSKLNNTNSWSSTTGGNVNYTYAYHFYFHHGVFQSHQKSATYGANCVRQP